MRDHLTFTGRALSTYSLCKCPQPLSYLCQLTAGRVSTLASEYLVKTQLPLWASCHWDCSPVFSDRAFCLKYTVRKSCLLICLHVYISRSCLSSVQCTHKLCLYVCVCLRYSHVTENNSVRMHRIKMLTSRTDSAL